MGADAVHCIDCDQLAQQAGDGGTRQSGLFGEVSRPCPAQSTKYLEQPNADSMTPGPGSSRALSVFGFNVMTRPPATNSGLSVALYTQHFAWVYQ